MLLDGHGRRQGHGVGPLLPFFLSAALHARGRGLGERAAAQALIPASKTSVSVKMTWQEASLLA